jgi:SAM-dependent methyltransferase
VQQALSVTPGGRSVNYRLQRTVSHRLPRRGADFDRHAQTAARHLRALGQVRAEVDRAGLRCYEFGAGWDLIGPIAMWSLGVNHQTLVDIRPNVKLDLVTDTIRRFARERIRLEGVLGDALRTPGEDPVTSLPQLASRFGITYLAPQNAQAPGLPDQSVDLVCSTFTLEHLPAAEIAGILAATRRTLAPGGVVSCLIDMHDHYIYSDPHLSAYNFLRYPSWLWRLLNPPLGWQSRLRHSEYLELFAQAGYEIVADDAQRPDEAAVRALARMHVARQFRGLDLIDLGTTATHLVARLAGDGYSSNSVSIQSMCWRSSEPTTST